MKIVFLSIQLKARATLSGGLSQIIRKNHMPRLKLIAFRGAFILAAISTVGCANLTAIQQFGKISADSAGYTALTDDYLSTFDRRKAWTFKDKPDELSALDTDTQERKGQGKELKIYHQVISEYMEALAALAADDVPNYDSELGGFIDEAVKFKAIDTADAAAAKSLSNLVATAATQLYRQAKLKDVIRDGNEPLQRVLVRMQFFVGTYARTATTERDAFDAYYTSLADRAAKGNEPMFSQYAWSMQNELSPIKAQKIEAAGKYSETLDKIAKAHQSLYDNLGKIDDKQFQSELKTYTKAIYAAYKAARASSKSAE